MASGDSDTTDWVCSVRSPATRRAQVVPPVSIDICFVADARVLLSLTCMAWRQGFSLDTGVDTFRTMDTPEANGVVLEKQVIRDRGLSHFPRHGGAARATGRPRPRPSAVESASWLQPLNPRCFMRIKLRIKSEKTAVRFQASAFKKTMLFSVHYTASSPRPRRVPPTRRRYPRASVVTSPGADAGTAQRRTAWMEVMADSGSSTCW